MVEESEQLIEEIRRIKKQYVAEIGSGRRTWLKSIKERIAQLDLMGVPAKAIAAQTEVPYEMILVWRHKRKKSQTMFHEVAVEHITYHC